ncbi:MULTISPECIES: hypothetical protein [Rhizobium]|uniref:hypothetical protein n=1 Tax=Rhizobium phaseoli TaxID=396 RepID=UPI000A1C191C|nr:hypothetical protein [Rhizobium phaseoli]ARM12086.1 hypothetical protein Bra5_CH01849 [Rhizobium phaseoli Brasil 5]
MSEQELKWLPCDWMDEYVPDPQTDPNAFVCQDQTGWFLRPVEEEEDYPFLKLVEGQTVRFNATENYGDFTLTIHDDGTFETDREIPAKANCFRLDHDTDTLQSSLSDLVACGYLGTSVEPGSYDIDAYWWSEEEYAFTFSIVDGNGRLTQAGVIQ